MSEWCTPCKPRLHARGGLKSLGCNKARWILDGDDTECTARLAAMKAKEDALEADGGGSRRGRRSRRNRGAADTANNKIAEALADIAKPESLHDNAHEAASYARSADKRSKVGLGVPGFHP